MSAHNGESCQFEPRSAHHNQRALDAEDGVAVQIFVAVKVKSCDQLLESSGLTKKRDGCRLARRIAQRA